MDYLFLIPKISGSIVEVPKIIEEGFGDNDVQVFFNFIRILSYTYLQ